MAKKEERTITLTLSFAEPEFNIVKKALGDQPATTLLEWCAVSGLQTKKESISKEL